MFHQKPHSSPTKKGAASFYVVIFLTLVLSVITLSFVRLMISEVQMSSDSDLSQSAHDSALAGIEDAKSAITKAYSQNQIQTLFQEGVKNNCYGMANYLYGSTSEQKEIKIQEGSSGSSGNTFDQAYTCVKLENSLSDYIATLTATNNVYVIPLPAGTNNITIQWYTQNDGGARITDRDLSSDRKVRFFPYSQAANLPVLSAQVFNSDSNNYIMTLYPTISSEGTNSLTLGENFRSETNNPDLSANRDSKAQSVQLTRCNNDSEFACTMAINNISFDNAFLVLHKPYVDQQLTFRVTAKNISNQQLKFDDVQVSIDSTGRANDFYRRVVTRVNIKGNFPYPQYVAQIGSDTSDKGQGNIVKHLWSTTNCKTTELKDSGTETTVLDCPNFGE